MQANIPVSNKDLAQFIDHTILRPEATQDQILRATQEALAFSFFGVCVNSSFVPVVHQQLKNSSVKTVAVIGFPLGAMSTEAKSFETEWCVKNGADEIDMVIHLGYLKDRKESAVQKDIQAVVKAAQGKVVKVIIETSLLNEQEIVWACRVSRNAGAHFVKTCTGFNGGGATVTDITLMRATVGPQMGVKASGGVKTLDQALALIKAGANRIGTSSGVQLVQGLKVTGGY